MTSIAPTDVDIITESSLTTLSDLTPTDPGDEPPEIRALTAAVDDAAFDLAYEVCLRSYALKSAALLLQDTKP